MKPMCTGCGCIWTFEQTKQNTNTHTNGIGEETRYRFCLSSIGGETPYEYEPNARHTADWLSNISVSQIISFSAQRIVSKYTVKCFGFVHSCCVRFNLVCSYTWVRLYVHVCSIHMHTAYRSYLSLSLFVYWIVLFHAKLTRPSSVKSTKLCERIRWRLFIFFWEYNLFIQCIRNEVLWTRRWQPGIVFVVDTWCEIKWTEKSQHSVTRCLVWRFTELQERSKCHLLVINHIHCFGWNSYQLDDLWFVQFCKFLLTRFVCFVGLFRFLIANSLHNGTQWISHVM